MGERSNADASCDGELYTRVGLRDGDPASSSWGVLGRLALALDPLLGRTDGDRSDMRNFY
jgi:hypothetical protein